MFLLATLLGSHRQLKPFLCEAEPRLLVERAPRVLCLLSGFVSLRKESVGIGHTQPDTLRSQNSHSVF
jgi:hypothetical protein